MIAQAPRFEGSDEVLRAMLIQLCIVITRDRGVSGAWCQRSKKKSGGKSLRIVTFGKTSTPIRCTEIGELNAVSISIPHSLLQEKKAKRPDFIDPEFWEEDDTFKRQSEMNKRNRASAAPNGIGLFVGGRKPLVKIKTEYEKYRVLCERFKESHPAGMREEDANNLWCEATGGRKKGDAFCLASFGKFTQFRFY